MYMRRTGAIPIGELSKVFGHKPSSLTSMVDRMETRKLIARKPHPKDRRSVMVSLTGQGRAIAERVEQSLQSIEKSVVEQSTERDLAGFETVLQLISNAGATAR